MLALIAGLALVLAACGTDLNRAGHAAIVNGTEITVAELEERFQQAADTPQVAQQLESDPDRVRPALQAQLLTQLVQSELLRQGAAELGVEASDADVAAQREMLVNQVGGEEAFQGLLEDNGFTEEQVTELLGDLALQEKVTDQLTAGQESSEEDVQAFYEDNYGPTVSARHILVEDEARAQEVMDRLESGEDFADVARDASTDTVSAQQGGDLGEISRGQTVPEFEEAVFGADVGDVVGPVETQFGFHVIEVTEQHEAPPLEEVRAEVETQLQAPQRQAAVQEWLQEQISKAEVEINPRFGTWNAETGQVVPAEPLGEVGEVPQQSDAPQSPATPESPATPAPPAATEPPATPSG